MRGVNHARKGEESADRWITARIISDEIMTVVGAVSGDTN